MVAGGGKGGVDGEGGRVTDFVGAGVDEVGGGGVAFVVFLSGGLGSGVGGAELDVAVAQVGGYPGHWSFWGDRKRHES